MISHVHSLKKKRQLKEDANIVCFGNNVSWVNILHLIQMMSIRGLPAMKPCAYEHLLINLDSTL